MRLALGCVLALAGCFVDVSDGVLPVAVGDAAPDVGGAIPDAAVESAPFRWVWIVDISREENQRGTAGVDICGLEASCDGVAGRTGRDARLVAGEGAVCAGDDGAGCSADRGDPGAALDPGSACDPASMPSDYVSLGVGGTLAVDFGEDLRGCSVEVVEFAGSDVEGYEVYVCRDPDGRECLAGGTYPDGGDVHYQVPSD